MKQFEIPSIEIQTFAVEDVVTTSVIIDEGEGEKGETGIY